MFPYQSSKNCIKGIHVIPFPSQRHVVALTKILHVALANTWLKSSSTQLHMYTIVS